MRRHVHNSDDIVGVMDKTPPALLPILRTRHTGEILALLFLHPDQEFPLGELAARVGAPRGTIHAEVERLQQSELVSSRQIGRARLIRANTGNRYAAPIAQLVTLAFGPHSVIADEFAGIAGVDGVLIFGSWAARYHGVFGPPPNDIDVLVVGDPRRSDVYSAAIRAQDRLGVEVNPVIRSRADWSASGDALIEEIRTRPVVVVKGDEEFGLVGAG